MERESDKLLGKLKRTLRAEVAQELMLERLGLLPSPPRKLFTAAFGRPTNPVPGHASIVLVMTTLLSARVGVVRLCIDPRLSDEWSVLDARVGTFPLIDGARPMPAIAFPPLPEWFAEKQPDDVAKLLLTVPISNVPNRLVYPGVQVSLTLSNDSDRAYASALVPSAWMLLEEQPED